LFVSDRWGRGDDQSDVSGLAADVGLALPDRAAGVLRAALVGLPLRVLRVVGAARFVALGATVLVAAFVAIGLDAGFAAAFFGAVDLTGLAGASFGAAALVAVLAVAGFAAAGLAAGVFDVEVFAGADLAADFVGSALIIGFFAAVAGFAVVFGAGFAAVFAAVFAGAGFVVVFVEVFGATVLVSGFFATVFGVVILAAIVLTGFIVLDFAGAVLLLVRMARACAAVAVLVVTRMLLRSGDKLENSRYSTDRKHDDSGAFGLHFGACPDRSCRMTR